MINLQDLNQAERDTYQMLLDNYKAKQLEVKDVRIAITNMKNSVALEIAKTPYEEKDKIIKLQARIENYIALEMLFEAPEKAELAIRQAEANLERSIEQNRKK